MTIHREGVSDQELVRAARAGDPESLGVLLSRHRAPLLALAIRDPRPRARGPRRGARDRRRRAAPAGRAARPGGGGRLAARGACQRVPRRAPTRPRRGGGRVALVARRRALGARGGGEPGAPGPARVGVDGHRAPARGAAADGHPAPLRDRLLVRGDRGGLRRAGRHGAQPPQPRAAPAGRVAARHRRRAPREAGFGGGAGAPVPGGHSRRRARRRQPRLPRALPAGRGRQLRRAGGRVPRRRPTSPGTARPASRR